MPIPYKADNGVWCAKWTEGRRSKRKSLGTKDQDLAKTRLAQILLIDGFNQDTVAPDELTVADLWSVYDRKHIENVASPATARYAWAALAPHFGPLPASEAPDAVPAYVERRSRIVRLSTIRRELVTLRACLNWCSNGLSHRALIDPVKPFKLPAEGKPRDRWFTQVEIDRLFAAAENEPLRVRLFMHLALETAGREAALLDLTWDRVDFETKVIHLADPAKTQTKKRRASVPISAALLPVLKGAYETRRHDLVLERKNPVYQQIKRVAAAAKVSGASPNVFRHTAATRMARNGVPLWIIAKVLGNSLELVERVYAKHAPDDLRSAVDIISGGK